MGACEDQVEIRAGTGSNGPHASKCVQFAGTHTMTSSDEIASCEQLLHVHGRPIASRSGRLGLPPTKSRPGSLSQLVRDLAGLRRVSSQVSFKGQLRVRACSRHACLAARRAPGIGWPAAIDARAQVIGTRVMDSVMQPVFLGGEIITPFLNHVGADPNDHLLDSSFQLDLEFGAWSNCSAG